MQSEAMRILIVEDEPSASQNLQNLLNKYVPEVEVIGISENVKDAIQKINSSQPDLILLDIQLGDQTSFEVLEKVDLEKFDVIFVTAYNNYALKAFQYSAVDYLLKPINPILLQKAVRKSAEKRKNINASLMLNTLLDNLKGKSKSLEKIVLSTAEMMHVVEVDSIVKCQSSGNYTTFYFKDGKQLVISRTLKEFDEQLSDSGFFRVHRSWLVNQSYIIGYDKREGGGVVLKDQSRLPVSPTKKEELLILLENKAS